MYSGEFGPVSNRAVWSETISLKQASDNAAPDLDEIELAFGSSRGCKITKTLTGGGLDYDDETGVLSFAIPESEMRRFDPGRYDMGITYTMSGVEEQLFAGTLVIIDGVVT